MKNCTPVQRYSRVPTTPKPVASTALLPQQFGMTTFVGGNESLAAEVSWTVKITSSYYRYKSCDSVAALFGRIFPDSAIMSQFTCGKRKCA